MPRTVYIGENLERLRRRAACPHRRTLVRTEKVRWVHILNKQPALEAPPRALVACGKVGGGGKKINSRPSFMSLSPPNLRECLKQITRPPRVGAGSSHH